MMSTKGAPPDQGDALLHRFERLEREIGQQFRSDPDLSATPALRLKLIGLIDELDRMLGEIRTERDALKREIDGVDDAVTATQAYRTGSRLGQSKQSA
jgi:hypothetical protein